MNDLTKIFLEKDMKKAQGRISFMKYCLQRSYELIMQNDVELSEIWVDEYKKCANEVNEMIRSKKFHDDEQNKLKNLIYDLQERGVKVEVVIRKLGDLYE